MTTTKEQIRELDDLRREHGANSDVGRICSNKIEQLKSRATAETPEQHEALEGFMADADAHIVRLLVGA